MATKKPRGAPKYNLITPVTINHPNHIPTWNRNPPSSSSLETVEFEFDDDTKYFFTIAMQVTEYEVNMKLVSILLL